MTVRTVCLMGACIDKCICMTGCTVICRSCCYKAAVIRCCCMQTTPVSTVTRGTVAAGCKSLTNCNTRQAAVTIMTGSTCIMRCRICTYQCRIGMTGGAIRSCYLDQARMIRCDRCMRGLPTGVMTRLTVAARCKVFTDCKAHQRTVACVMAVGAVGKMGACID